MMLKNIFILLLLFGSCVKAVDLVVFSYDRPMQLYAFCESVKKYITDLSSIQIIYRTSSDAFEKGYKEVKDKFREIKFIKQGCRPELDFKPLLLKAVFESENNHILFAVDDIVVTDYVDLKKCVEAMEKEKASGFYLRLGKNITECYTIGIQFAVPTLSPVGGNIKKWNFKDGSGDWGFVGTVDMTVYRKKDLHQVMHNSNYYNPNNFEFYAMGGLKGEVGLCFETSKIINVPLNLVQEVKWHRNMNFLSTKELLTMFMSRHKMDIMQFYKILPSAPHSEHIPKFVPRD